MSANVTGLCLLKDRQATIKMVIDCRAYKFTEKNFTFVFIPYYFRNFPIINNLKTIYMFWHIHTYLATAQFRTCMPLPGPWPSSLCVPSMVLPLLTHTPFPVSFNLPSTVALQKSDANQLLFLMIFLPSLPFFLLSFYLPLFLFLSLLENPNKVNTQKVFTSTTHPAPKSPSHSTFSFSTNMYEGGLFQKHPAM